MMHATSILLALGLALAPITALQAAGPDAAAPGKGSLPFETTSCLRVQMDDVALNVRTLTRIRDTNKGGGFVPVAAKAIQLDLLLLDKCQLSTMDATRAFAAVKQSLAAGAQALKANPDDLSAVDTLRAAVLDYERQFHDEFRRESQLTPRS